MSLIVQKYGGSSLATPQHIQRVANRIQKLQKDYSEIVIVVSAMKGITDQLINLAKKTAGNKLKASELDALLATGENQSSHLLALALHQIGSKAKALNGFQAGIQVEGNHGNAKIQAIDIKKIQKSLKKEEIIIIPGFQGINDGKIYTLGRGGSDLTAIALASALKADKCQILTDVDGVYTADPKLVDKSKKIEEISYDEMLELSSSGSKVMQSRAVEVAKKFAIDFEVSSSFNERLGTLVKKDTKMEEVIIRGVSAETEQSRITVSEINDTPGAGASLLESLKDTNIDMIVVNVSPTKKRRISFTLHEDLLTKTLQAIKEKHPDLDLETEKHLSKISIVGIGMRSHSGIAHQMFATLGKAKINIGLVSTSEIKISVTIDEKDTQKAMESLHNAFELEK